jgi:UDP-glucose 4-epimerase
VFGDGEQTRDFVYVGDVVEVLMQALELPAVTVGACNVGLGQTTTLKQLLVEIAGVLGGLPAVNYGAARPGDIRHSRANNARLLSNYTFPQPTPMAVGLARLLGRE